VAADRDLAPESGGVAGTGGRLVQPLRYGDGAAEGQPEYAEAVGHADAEMNGERRRRNEPAVVVRSTLGSPASKYVICLAEIDIPK
jgi:hypothetical protein